jgi:hypothetical protein
MLAVFFTLLSVDVTLLFCRVKVPSIKSPFLRRYLSLDKTLLKPTFATLLLR